MIALAGLGALAVLFTAPFADPPAAAGDIRTAALSAAIAADNNGQQVPFARPQLPASRLPRDPGPALRPVAVAAATPADITEAEAELLPADDPRWAKPDALQVISPGLHPDSTVATATGAAEPSTVQADGVSLASPLAALQDEPENSAVQAPMDATQTAAIPPEEPIVETVKPKQGKVRAAGAAASGAAPSSTVAVTSAVKMRARAANGAAIVAVIPDNAAVGLVDCDDWCEVVYKGRRGFIFKNFIGKPAVAVPAKTQAASDQRKPKIEKPTQVDFHRVGR